jgi:CRP-like cAMP-binding protein
MYFLLDGTVRARLLVGLDDKTLARIAPGEFFGEMAMFTQSPRSADVVAETNARLLRFGADSFHRLIKENPEAAAPMLFAIARTMANRIWEDNTRFQREVAADFVWR